MATLGNQYNEYSLHKLIVDALEDDGAICNSSMKEYDEQKTYEGGNSNRLAFKKINDKINRYHEILKLIRGDWRAKLTEQIPVIDFSHPENTSLAASYPLMENSTTEIDPSVIMGINPEDGSTALDMIVNEDPALLNRALIGYDIAEHFYNTKEDNVTEYAVQVAAYKGDNAVVYNGMKSAPAINAYTLAIVTTTRYDSILVFQNLSESLSFNYNPTQDFENYDPSKLYDDFGNRKPYYDDTHGTIDVMGYTIVDNIKDNAATPDITRSIQIQSNDIIVILPSSNHSPDNIRVLLLRYNQNYNATSEDPSSLPYELFYLEVTKYLDTLPLKEINVGDPLPSYLCSEFLIKKLSDYIILEKEYYSDASCYLNGCFCEPKERNALNEVTRWKIVNEMDTASEKETTINIGSKYYEGHVIGRGRPIDAPFKLTGGEEASWDRNFNNIPHKVWNGKASYIYDSIFEQSKNLLKAVQTENRTEWLDSFELRRLDYIVKKSDYAGVTGTVLSAAEFKSLLGEDRSSAAIPNIRVKHASKFKTVNNKIVTYEDIKTYIDTCIDHVKEDAEGMYLDLSNLLMDTSVAWARGEFVDNTKDKNSMSSSGNTDENAVYTNPELIFHIGWAAVRKKKGGWKSEHREERLNIASPIEAFAPKGAPSKKVMLIYPDYNNKLPGEMYLISSWDLGLQEYSDLQRKEDGSMPDYGNNRGMCSFYNSNGKIISFKVSTVAKFLYSKINRIKWYDPALSKVHTTWGWDTKGNTNWDCYIYTLRPMELSLRGLEVLDWEDRIMDLEDGIPDLQIVPMSYPRDYFKCTSKYNSGNLEYVIDSSHINDLRYLEDSYIIAGLPAYNNASEFRKIKKSGLTLKYFAEMLDDNNTEGIGQALRKVLQKGVNYAVNSFPLSDGDKNPMLFDSFEDILNSFLKLKPELNDLVNSGFEIPEYSEDSTGNTATTYRRLVVGDIQGINERVDYQDRVLDYTVSISDSKAHSSSEKENFLDLLSDRISDISYTSSNTFTPRPSLTELYNEFKSGFGEGADLSRENCQLIDKRLGNNTKAFMRYGTGTGQEMTLPTSIATASNDLEIKIRNIILEMDELYEQKRSIEKRKEIYRKWFTNSSVEKAFSSSTVNLNALVIDFYNVNSQGESVDNQGPFTIKAHPFNDSYLNNLKSNKNAVGNFFDRLRVMGWIQRWRRMDLQSFKNYLRLQEPNLYSWSSDINAQKSYVLSYMRNWTLNQAESAWKSSGVGSPVYITEDQIAEYVSTTVGDQLALSVTDIKINNKEELSNLLSGKEYSVVINGTTYNKDTIWDYMQSMDLDYIRECRFVVPDKSISENTCTLVPSSTIIYEYSIPFTDDNPDVYPEILNNIAEFMDVSLEGKEEDSEDSAFIRYVKGMSEPEGRKNSLYYKRYEMLNNRINRASGYLSNAARYLMQKATLQKISNIKDSLATSYEKFVEVIDVKKYEPLAYFPRQISTASTIPMDGKFYYKKELDALREQIADKCVLTCNHCLIKNSCPFYNEEEILKLYCTEADAIDLYFKDNELDLIVYDNNSPNLVYTSEDGLVSESLDPNILKNIHNPYSDILKKISVNSNDEIKEEAYIANDLNKIREQLKETYGDTYEEETRAGLGFLLNGRYGTVQVNDLYKLKNSTSSMSNDEIDTDNISKYKSLYDAVFIKDTDTEILYKVSNSSYPVEVIIGPRGNKKVYKGTTKIKIPASLRILQDADPEDELYLVSDDRRDPTGREIMPVIFLNTVGNLEMSFDLTDTSPGISATSSADTQLYAQDVAQWCINYAKGNCYQDPIGSSDEASKDMDQYWMPEIRKKIVDSKGTSKYITLKGRERVNSGYQEPCTDETSIDQGAIISGHPVVNTYIDFIRRFRIRMYKMVDGKKVDTIQWLKPNTTLYPEYKDLKDKIEMHKSILPLMQTNLRLVLVKKIE